MRTAGGVGVAPVAGEIVDLGLDVGDGVEAGLGNNAARTSTVAAVT